MGNQNNGSATVLPDTEAGKKVQQQLSDEHTLHAISNLLARIDTLEKAVENLTSLMHQGPGLIAMTGDMVDEAYRKADAKGISIDERLKNTLSIAEKLTAPEVVDKLDGVLKFTNQLPGLIAMQADMVDEAYRKANARGIDVDQRLSTALQMAEKLTAPEMMEKLNGLIKLSEQMPGLIAMTVDIMDEGMAKAVDHGFNPNTLMHISGVANTALTNSRAEPPLKVKGIFSMLRALKEPGIQKGLGFFLNFLKHFGRNV